MSLDVTATGATFGQEWELFAEAWVPLPGDRANWPIEVLVDGGAAAVVTWGGRPSVRLAPGSHRVSGALRWTTRPASIAIPTESALVSLRLDGSQVTFPEVEGGTLWLGVRPDDVLEDDRLDVVVHRLLRDDLPITLETVIQMDVAGRNREAGLVGALLPTFTGERLEAELPAQLDGDGTLRLQVRPGRWTLSFFSRAPDGIGQLQIPQAVEPWPEEEIWSYRGNPRLRVAGLEGAPPVDATLAGIPPEWGDFPAFQVTAGQSLNLVERSRNDADTRNVLHLGRNLWMDFDGSGFTAQDTVYGAMHRAWRLDMADPYVMTMASVKGENLLVTEGADPGVQGVEIRDPELMVQTTARTDSRRRLAVTGYLQSFDSAAATLNLPPAHRLMAAPGADAASGTWLDSWRLLDIFLVLIVAVAAWRLMGPGAGVAALIAMALAFHEPLAPRWLWLNALVAVGMFQAAPGGRLRMFGRWYRNASLLALIVALIPFVTVQTTAVVFPQLERARGDLGETILPGQRAVPAQARWNEMIPETDSLAAPDFESLRETALAEPRLDALEAAAVTGLEAAAVAASQIGDTLPRYPPGAMLQTGPGLPDWSWNTYTLAWTGPIEPAQSFRMVIFGPWLVAAWRIAGVGAALALLYFLLRPHIDHVRRKVFAGGRAVPVVLAMLMSPQEGPAQEIGEFPSTELLRELQRRLVAPEPCQPSCAEITRARVTLDGSMLSVDSTIAVESPVAVPMPGSNGGWRADSIVLNGQSAPQLYQHPDGASWIRLDEGVHEVLLRGPATEENSFTLPFPLVPKHIAVDAVEWEAAGVVEGRLISGALEFMRQPEPDATDDDGALATSFPPYVSIVREITLGLNWSMRTEVGRVAPAAGAFTLAVELLPGEVVLTPGIEIREDQALIALESNGDHAGWESRLPTAESLTLTAPENAPWTERWRFVVSPIWNVQFDGIPRTPPLGSRNPFFVPEYDPRPGESLTLSLTQPQPSSGDMIAIDEVDYSMRVGDRSSTLTLELDYRSTRGMQHVLRLPEDSELDGVFIDSAEIPLMLEGDLLEIPINPGLHTVEVNWRTPRGVGLRSSLPQVDLGVGAGNLYSSVSLPSDRWIIHTFGPRLGPAVLYWPELLLLGLGALLLGRFAWSPLRIREWLLLGIGLSTFAWPVLLLFASWAFILSWRGQTQIKLTRGLFNGMQISLGLLTACTLAAVVAAIPRGLLGEPDMQITAPSGLQPLTWFSDRSDGATPPAGVVTISIWFYRVAMLAWALWLSFALLRWIPWAWQALNHNGMWRGRVAAAP